MTCSNILQFPGQHNAAQPVTARRRRTDKNSIRGLSEALIVRVEETPARFHKLFLLRLEILVNELEMDVDKYSDID